MSEDREHKRDGERDDASRPRSAAERRASARPASRKDRGGGDAGSAKGEVVSSAGTTPKKGRPTDSRDTKGKRPSLPRRLGRFIREVVAELRKVIWPTRKQMVTYTLVVLVFVSFMVTLVAGLDIAFSQGVLWLFG